MGGGGGDAFFNFIHWCSWPFYTLCFVISFPWQTLPWMQRNPYHIVDIGWLYSLYIHIECILCVCHDLPFRLHINNMGWPPINVHAVTAAPGSGTISESDMNYWCLDWLVLVMENFMEVFIGKARIIEPFQINAGNSIICHVLLTDGRLKLTEATAIGIHVVGAFGSLKPCHWRWKATERTSKILEPSMTET